MEYYSLPKQQANRIRDAGNQGQIRNRFNSPDIHHLAKEAFGGRRDNNQYTSVWQKLDIQRPYSGQNGSAPRWSEKGSSS